MNCCALGTIKQLIANYKLSAGKLNVRFDFILLIETARAVTRFTFFCPHEYDLFQWNRPYSWYFRTFGNLMRYNFDDFHLFVCIGFLSFAVELSWNKWHASLVLTATVECINTWLYRMTIYNFKIYVFPFIFDWHQTLFSSWICYFDDFLYTTSQFTGDYHKSFFSIWNTERAEIAK